MKKILLMALVTVMLASCAKPETTDLASQSPETRAINDIFKIEDMGFGVRTRGNVDFQGNLYSYEGSRFYDLVKKESFDFPLANKMYSLIPSSSFWLADWCFDNKNNIIIAGNQSDTGPGYVYMLTPDMNSMVDLTPYFPSMYVYGVCAAENGNIFVSAGDEKIYSEYGYDIYVTQKIYRLNITNGVVKEVVSGIEGICEGDIWRLKKMKGAFVGGTCGEDRLFKANTNTGEIEYITPHFTVDHYMTASNMPNFYAINNAKIFEIRPATDFVIGTVPSSYIDENGDTVLINYDHLYNGMSFCVNADATVFYCNNFKLSLQ